MACILELPFYHIISSNLMYQFEDSLLCEACLLEQYSRAYVHKCVHLVKSHTSTVFKIIFSYRDYIKQAIASPLVISNGILCL